MYTRRMERTTEKRKLGAVSWVQKAEVSAEAMLLVRGGMMGQQVPANFVPPVPPRDDNTNIAVEDHTASFQASFLRVRRPMSVKMAEWVVKKVGEERVVVPKKATKEQVVTLQAAAWGREAPTYELALEFRDVYRVAKRPVPEALDRHIAALKAAGEKKDNELKMETRVVFGPVEFIHDKRPTSVAVSAAPAVSGKTYLKWDTACREVFGDTIGVGNLMAPALVVYQNLGKSPAEIKALLRGGNFSTAGAPIGGAKDGSPGLVKHEADADDSAGVVSHDGVEPPAKRYAVPIGGVWKWASGNWIGETDEGGNITYHHKDAVPAIGLIKAGAAPPQLPLTDSPGSLLQPRTSGISHDAMLPGGATLSPRPREKDWREVVVKEESPEYGPPVEV